MYQKEVKESNENKIFKYIFDIERNFTIPDLAKDNNISFPTAKRIISELVEKKIVLEWAISRGGVGRRAVEYRYNNQFCYCVGCSIDEDKIKIILTDTKGEKIFYKAFPKDESKDIISSVINNLKDFFAFLNAKDEKYLNNLFGVGISIPGIYNKEANFLEFDLIKRESGEVIKEIENKIGHKVWIENESNMSVLAEAILGNKKKLSDFTIINIGTFVSCSSFIKFGSKNDQYFFKASRIHHMIVDYKNNKKVGDLISIKSLKNEIKNYFPDVKSLDDFFLNKNYIESKNGKKIVDNFVFHVAMTLKNLIFTYNPKNLIICGELSLYGNLLHKKLLDVVYEKNHIFYRGPEVLSFSSFKGESNLIGAAIFPLVDVLM